MSISKAVVLNRGGRVSPGGARGLPPPKTWKVWSINAFVFANCLKSGGLETKDNYLREAWQRKRLRTTDLKRMLRNFHLFSQIGFFKLLDTTRVPYFIAGHPGWRVIVNGLQIISEYWFLIHTEFMSVWIFNTKSVQSLFASSSKYKLCKYILYRLH